MGLGLRPKRFVATVGKVRGADVVVSMDRIVPVLATVTTTTSASAANGTGFDRRKTMGNGQFLTYDQIASKHATSITQLLQGMTGTSVMPSSLMPGSAASGTRGPGSCVSYVVDGVPQLQLMEHTVDGGVISGESPDNLIDISNVGALEVYSASERPAEFQSMQEHPMQPGTPPPRVGIDRQQCALVVVWTKAKAGVSGGAGRAGGAPAKSVVGAGRCDARGRGVRGGLRVYGAAGAVEDRSAGVCDDPGRAIAAGAGWAGVAGVCRARAGRGASVDVAADGAAAAEFWSRGDADASDA